MGTGKEKANQAERQKGKRCQGERARTWMKGRESKKEEWWCRRAEGRGVRRPGRRRSDAL